MSILLQESPVAEAQEAESAPAPRGGFTRFLAASCGLIVRSLIGMWLCFSHVGSVLVVGWTFRLMRRQIHKGWWQISPARNRYPFAEFAAEPGRDIPSGSTPRWLLSDRFRARLSLPDRHGRAPSLGRRVARLPGALLASFGANLKAGLVAVVCTYILTLPAGTLMLGSWEYGWNNSFNKGYEQALVGPLTGIFGILVFVAAMHYVPMAWAHLAATGDARAFFQFGFVAKLIRQRRVAMTLFAAAFSVASLPVLVLWSVVSFFPQINPGLIDASAAQLQHVANVYIAWCGVYLFIAFVFVHLLIARIYRKAVLQILKRDPSLADDLHPKLAATLRALELIPAGPAPRRHPIVAVVLGTGQRVKNVVMWVASSLLWFTVAAQLYLAVFFRYHPFLVWLNQALIQLPSLYFLPGATQ